MKFELNAAVGENEEKPLSWARPRLPRVQLGLWERLLGILQNTLHRTYANAFLGTAGADGQTFVHLTTRLDRRAPNVPLSGAGAPAGTHPLFRGKRSRNNNPPQALARPATRILTGLSGVLPGPRAPPGTGATLMDAQRGQS